MSDILRITGMVSGFDTDMMVEKLVKAERTRIDPYEQEKQTLEWRQEAYREIASLMKGFQSERLDILNANNDMRSATNYNTYSSSILLAGSSTSIVSASPTVNASGASSTISSITSLATRDSWSSNGTVSDGILEGTVTLATVEAQITAGNDSFVLEVDGSSKTINLSGGYGSLTDLVNEINGQLGGGTLSASENGGNLEFSFSEVGHEVSITGDADLLSGLGMTNGEKNTISLGDSLATTFSVGTDQSFTINGEDFTFASTSSINNIISTVNSSGAGVTMSYNSLTDKFNLISNETGAINDIVIDDTSGFLAGSLKLDGVERTNGTDAVLVIDGVTTSRSSNTFETNGIKYTLNSTYDGSSGDIVVNVNKDVTAVVDKVKAFVESYNKVVEKINDLLGEEKDYDYKPLTAAQKEGMTETEIETWESKAKSGILSGDTILRNIQSKLRNSIVDAVEGSGMTFWDIGITSSSDYTDGGKLVVNEDRLEKALKENTSEVITLMTNNSSVDYRDTADRTTRYNQSGLMYRIEDIFKDAVRTSRIDGYKGSLLEKAGIEGDSSVSTNEIYNQIKDIEDKMSDMLLLLNDKETYYYEMFGKMEAALARMSAQSSMFSQS